MILALGSRGDVVPYAALGHALQATGHRVRLATFENYRGLVLAQGLEFRPIRGDAEALLQGGGGVQSNARTVGEAGHNVLKQVAAISQSFGQLARSVGPDVSAAAEGGVDLILNQLPGALYGADLAEALRVPMLMLAVMPLARTRAWPMLAFPARLGRVPGFSAISYFIAEQLLWQMFRAGVNGWRRSLGLRPRPAGGHFRELDRQAVPVLNGFSQRVVPRPPDWPAHVHITGYWFPAAEDWQAPAATELRRFIEAGPRAASGTASAPRAASGTASAPRAASGTASAPRAASGTASAPRAASGTASAPRAASGTASAPPVFIGFGSMPVRQAARATALLLEAVRLSGRRAVLHAGWGRLFQAGALPDGTDAARLPEDVFLLDYAPFDWLFPQMAAVVHHGGAGTTGAGLRAGVPSVIVPFVMDQFFWGDRVAALGAGPRPVPFAKLSAQRLAGAIDQAVSDPEIRRRAAALGREINAEDGVGRAVALVEEALGG